ncbi:MAG TPA: uroporphyrinogen-III synthase [Thermoanaerobaculia bacterium]
MKPRLLVVRSGERPFPQELVPALEVVERVTHTIETLHPDPALVAGRFDMVIVTSRATADRLLARPDLLSRLSGSAFAVGPATAERLRSELSIEVEEGGGSARSLLERIPANLAGQRALLPRGDDASDELPRELAARGAEVVPLTLYRKISRAYDDSLDPIIVAADLAAFFATSPAAARWLFDGASREAQDRLRKTPGIALGDATAEDLTRRRVSRVEIAEPPTFEAVAAVARDLAARAPRA